MFLLLASVAFACPPTQTSVEGASAAFEDAELAVAATHVEAGLSNLGCQRELVSRGTLLELYRLDAQIGLARGENDAAAFATIRGVIAAPDEAPPESYGPELSALHRKWSGRLEQAVVRLSASGGGVVYVDGLPLVDGERVEVVRGHHLVQIDTGRKVFSTVAEVDQSQVVVTGLPVGRDALAEVPDDDVEPTVAMIEAPDERIRAARRPRRPRMLPLVAGTVVGLVGGSLVGLGTWREASFKTTEFSDRSAVERAARRTRTLYGVGYGMIGAGGVAAGIGLVGRPVGVRLEGRW